MLRTSRGDLNYVGDTEGHPDAPANRTDVSPSQPVERPVEPRTEAGRDLDSWLSSVWPEADQDLYRTLILAIEDEAASRVVAEIRERLLGDSAPVDALYERYTRAILDDIAADTAGSREANRIPHTPPRSLEEELDRIEATYPDLDALSAAHDKEGTGD